VNVELSPCAPPVIAGWRSSRAENGERTAAKKANRGKMYFRSFLDPAPAMLNEEHDVRCLPNTRIALLDEIATWANNKDDKSLCRTPGASYE
jgi:hypothetical protein